MVWYRKCRLTKQSSFVYFLQRFNQLTSYLCPISCAIVCAKVIPLSSLTLQLLSELHIPPTCATPKVLQGTFCLAHMSFRVIRMATSWWCGCVSFLGFKFFCHLQKFLSVVSAFTVTLSRGSEAVSSMRIIFTTTTLT